ncbi:MAG: AMP-binding protein [SAR202 cluster bacterium]|jgi:cyclohexanecarboxylate-CoA ligase|nr:AMP-binding protein [SAR202 cluster bacterium]MQG68930.1 AMP-binding protein [SAR202 cluster bacterium]HAL48161.1 cyclohexanecarboxylate-CoA ligase [Dehalococcoidia bacterium]|tara:strand:+ start:2958 stop:4610 length:1653 start_codon:yes stop_codon:yes gene_type:complete
MLQTPQELVERYQREGWWRDIVVTDYLDRWADEKPDQVALVSHFYATDRTATLSYRQLHRLVDRAAWALIDLGVGPGDRVAVQLPNWWHFTLIYLACARIGAVIVPITPIMRHLQIKHMLDRTEARVMVIPPNFRNFDYGAMMEELSDELPSLRAVIVVGDPVPEGMLSFERDVLLQRREVGRSSEELRMLRPDPIHDVGAICFTSGTTGEPKGVMHSQATIMYHSRSPGSVLGLNRDDRILMGSPLGHYTGFAFGINMPLALGSKTVLMDMWEPETAVRLIAEEGVTWTMGATPFLMDLTRTDALDRYNVSTLRYFVCAGATIPNALVEEAHQRLPCRVISAWGMTEDGAVTFVRPTDPPSRAAESDGGPVPGMEVRIVNPVSREPLPAGAEGALEARGPGQFVGYYKRPDLWEEAYDAQQWFDTGDLARMDEQGYIRISGRTKDIVIRGGENIPVVEVEEILFRHPKVREAAVVGTPDPRMGERACACVTLNAGEQLTFEDLQTWFDQSQTAKQYWPERLEVFDELPKTPSGKIQKFLLRDWVADRTE